MSSSTGDLGAGRAVIVSSELSRLMSGRMTSSRLCFVSLGVGGRIGFADSSELSRLIPGRTTSSRFFCVSLGVGGRIGLAVGMPSDIVSGTSMIRSMG